MFVVQTKGNINETYCGLLLCKKLKDLLRLNFQIVEKTKTSQMSHNYLWDLQTAFMKTLVVI